MPSLIELTAQIVAKHVSKTVMTQEQLLQGMYLIHEALRLMQEGVSPEQRAVEPIASALTVKQAFRKNEIICMLCNKGGFKTLTRHITTAHNLKPGQYRKQFNIPSSRKLAAKSYSESRRLAAKERGMVDVLAKARETRMSNIEAKKNLPVVKSKAPATAKRVKADVPVLKKKAAAPVTK